MMKIHKRCHDLLYRPKVKTKKIINCFCDFLIIVSFLGVAIGISYISIVTIARLITPA